MTQSKDEFTINLDDDYFTSDDTITIDTTYWNGDNLTDITVSSTDNSSYTISLDDTSDITFNTNDYVYTDDRINPDKIERMIKHYPGLEKVWRNFKHVYDMCNQDYKGKIEAGEINEFDDDITF